MDYPHRTRHDWILRSTPCQVVWFRVGGWVCRLDSHCIGTATVSPGSPYIAELDVS